MNSKTQYGILTNAYSRSHLIDQGKQNGVDWEESNDEGINWLRFSTALVKFLEAGNELHTDNADEGTLRSMFDNYNSIRELHKKTMIPHLRAAMSKLSSDRGSEVRPMELLSEAYAHLDKYGGSTWADKVHTMSRLNTHISNLSRRLGMTTEADGMPQDEDGGKTSTL